MTAATSSQGDVQAVPPADSPPVAPAGAAPLCFVVDEEPSLRHFVSLVLHGNGIDALEFADGAAMRAAIGERLPDVVFHNVSLESADAVESMMALGAKNFRGVVQLMSGRGAAVLEHVKAIGVQHKLNMLPVLKKPFETEAIRAILQELKLGLPPAVASRVDLAEALANNWIEFWYEPKIDLRRKQLAGAEACARARHPEHGIVLPTAFMPGAPESALIALGQRALECAMKASAGFAKLGLNLRLSVNIPLEALVKLPIEDLVKAQASGSNWPGLIIDVPEEQILADLSRASELSQKLERTNVWLAVDNFGRGHSALARLGDVPFAELKLDPAFVADCGTDKINAPLCKTVIDLAHAFGRAAIGTGIEKAADAVALVSMGCDYGQGFLLGQPMPEERFLSLLRQRAASQGKQLA